MAMLNDRLLAALPWLQRLTGTGKMFNGPPRTFHIRDVYWSERTMCSLWKKIESNLGFLLFDCNSYKKRNCWKARNFHFDFFTDHPNNDPITQVLLRNLSHHHQGTTPKAKAGKKGRAAKEKKVDVTSVQTGISWGRKVETKRILILKNLLWLVQRKG